MPVSTVIEDRLRERGLTAERLSRSEALEAWRQWRETFALAVKEATGRQVHRGYHWHAFSYGFTYAVARDEAHAAYRAVWNTFGEQELLLLPQGDERLAYRCIAPEPLELTGSECLVCPPGFAWTMAFTHEDGLFGPYFTTEEWAGHRNPGGPRPHRARRR